jgi:hypothetical protein
MLARQAESGNLVLRMHGRPRLIESALLFGHPEISGAQLSPNGEYIAFLKPGKNKFNIWVKDSVQPFSSAS